MTSTLPTSTDQYITNNHWPVHYQQSLTSTLSTIIDQHITNSHWPAHYQQSLTSALLTILQQIPKVTVTEYTITDQRITNSHWPAHYQVTDQRITKSLTSALPTITDQRITNSHWPAHYQQSCSRYPKWQLHFLLNYWGHSDFWLSHLYLTTYVYVSEMNIYRVSFRSEEAPRCFYWQNIIKLLRIC